MAQRLLAVYGTLKRPYGNHRLIQDAKLQFVGTAYTNNEEFFMQGGGFPYVYHPVPDGVGERIRVELYAFEDDNQIRSIDRLEGHPDWYRRTAFPFIVDQPEEGSNINENEQVTAEMYVIPDKQKAYTYGDNTVSRDVLTKIAEWNR